MIRILYTLVFIVLSSVPVFAGVDLPYSTTFDCAEWQESSDPDWSEINCDGIQQGPDQALNTTSIISAANNTANISGTKAIRFMKYDGVNQDSGIAQIALNTPQQEIWVRWYTRFESGFEWTSFHYDKMVIFNSNGSGIGGMSSSSNNIHFFSIYTLHPSAEYVTSNVGWWETFGGDSAVSDGTWHSIEIHAKMETAELSTDGVAQMWIDEVLVTDRDDVDWTNVEAQRIAGFGSIFFDSNQSEPGNASGIGSPAYVDWDDIAISATGYIGPVNPESTTPTVQGTQISGCRIQ